MRTWIRAFFYALNVVSAILLIGGLILWRVAQERNGRFGDREAKIERHGAVATQSFLMYGWDSNGIWFYKADRRFLFGQTYSPDGQLVGTPNQEDLANAASAEAHLHDISTLSWQSVLGFTYINDGHLIETSAIRGAAYGLPREHDYMHHVMIIVPFPLAVLPFAVIPLVGLIGFWRGHSTRRFRKEKGLCIQCGYDIRHSQSRCPECAAEIRPTPPARHVRKMDARHPPP